jgi:hypothetical protein
MKNFVYGQIDFAAAYIDERARYITYHFVNKTIGLNDKIAAIAVGFQCSVAHRADVRFRTASACTECAEIVLPQKIGNSVADFVPVYTVMQVPCMIIEKRTLT